MNNKVTNNQPQTTASYSNQPILTPIASNTQPNQIANTTQPIINQQQQPQLTQQNLTQTPQTQIQTPSTIPTTPINNSTPIPTDTQNKKTKRKKTSITSILIIIIVLLISYIIYSTLNHKVQITNLIYNCTPLTSSDEKKLNLDSTLVKDLYSKVSTNIREDLAQPEFNDNMRLYLAYRQILETEKYDSNCNSFDPQAMEPYTCEVSTKFKPKAFKIETLEKQIKKLYGEDTKIELNNIRLGENSCIGGYQYIPAREEFVQGFCNQQNSTSFKVNKKLVEATSTRNTIILKEEVKYLAGEKLNLPETLKNGIYYYTFRLDINYNYVLVSKTYKSKY